MKYYIYELTGDTKAAIFTFDNLETAKAEFADLSTNFRNNPKNASTYTLESEKGKIIEECN